MVLIGWETAAETKTEYRALDNIVRRSCSWSHFQQSSQNDDGGWNLRLFESQIRIWKKWSHFEGSTQQKGEQQLNRPFVTLSATASDVYVLSARLQYAHASVLLLYTFMREIQKSNMLSVLTWYILSLLRLKPIRLLYNLWYLLYMYCILATNSI